jgi:hypothetical protein
MQGPLVNLSENTLRGGTWIVDGTSAASTMDLSAFVSVQIVNNGANTVLSGPNANVGFVDGFGNNLLRSLAVNTTAGSGLTIENGYSLTTPGDFSNAGTVTVAKSSTLKTGPPGQAATPRAAAPCRASPPSMAT